MISQRIAPLVMAQSCARLMCASPAGPGKAVGKRAGKFPDEMKEQPPDFSQAQRHHQRKIRNHPEGIRAACFWFWDGIQRISLFLRMGSSPQACKAVKKAKLNIDKVMCRYQPCQERTSYSSKPTSPLASSKHCSTVQRVPKASTISSSEEPVGAKISTYAISAGLIPSFRLRRISSQRCHPPICGG